MRLAHFQTIDALKNVKVGHGCSRFNVLFDVAQAISPVGASAQSEYGFVLDYPKLVYAADNTVDLGEECIQGRDKTLKATKLNYNHILEVVLQASTTEYIEYFKTSKTRQAADKRVYPMQ